MNKTKAEVYREVLRDIFQNFESAENFFKQWIEETCEWRKISVEEVFYFYIFFIFYSVTYPLMKNSCLLLLCK